MIETKKLLGKLSKKFPKRLAKLNHDWVGLMTGDLPKNISRVLLCLDFDDIVLSKINEKNKPDIIITHHPFIYGPKSKVLKWDLYRVDLCNKLAELNIPVYSYHTNFDSGDGGMNDALAEKLELKNIRKIEEDLFVRAGDLPKTMSTKEAANYVKEKLGTPYGLLLPYGKKNVKSIAIVGGGGWSSYIACQKEGIDMFVSGDIPHHGRRGIVTSRYNYLDLPHEIERIYIPTMKNILLSIDPTLEIVCIDHEKYPEVI